MYVCRNCETTLVYRVAPPPSLDGGSRRRTAPARVLDSAFAPCVAPNGKLPIPLVPPLVSRAHHRVHTSLKKEVELTLKPTLHVPLGHICVVCTHAEHVSHA